MTITNTVFHNILKLVWKNLEKSEEEEGWKILKWYKKSLIGTSGASSEGQNADRNAESKG